MMDKDFASELAGIFNPPDIVRENMWREVGRAVVAISDIERVLAAICIRLSPASEREAVDIFMSDRMFASRLRFLTYLVARWNDPKLSLRWASIERKLQSHKRIRNLVAHQGMIEGEPDNLGLPQVCLHPLSLKRGGKKLTAKDIKATADMLQKLKHDVGLMLISIKEPPANRAR
ncbi:MAG: hypothetical protein J0I13_01480 [Rhizobiales bacterium]|nr:hypothetical protein [Hyphomicrobiales bacterium]